MTRARVVLEGEYSEGGAGTFSIQPDDAARSKHTGRWFDTDNPIVVSVEILAPEWEPGDVVSDADGCTYARCAGNWRVIGCVSYDDLSEHEDRPLEPLTLLVRGGKAVQP